MKRSIFYSLLLLVLSGANAYDYQNYSSVTVGPGIIHRKYIEPSVPWTLDVLEIDLSDTNNTIISVKADDNKIGHERLSSMSSRYDTTDHQVVGVINADFFDENGTPINGHVVDGEFVKTENVADTNPVYWSNISFDFNDLPTINRGKFLGEIFVNSVTDTIDDINAGRVLNELILYNHFIGDSIYTNEWGTEILLDNLNPWYANDTIFCVVDSKEERVGNMTIASNKVVLSGHGTSEDFIKNNISIGDTVKIFLGLESLPQKIKTLVGGYPKIVKNGNNYAYQGFAEEGGTNSFATARHPRTGVGISADSTKVFFITVDGRQEISDGMNLSEFANFMLTLGIETGINLDGGGSTEMFVRNKIVNSPSDGWERAVSNSLMAISTAPEDTLSIVQISPENKKVLVGSQFQFDISGWNKYYNPKSIVGAGVECNIDSNLGTIDEDGIFTASGNKNSGFIYVSYGNSIDSAFVDLRAVKSFNVYPNVVAIDTISSLDYIVEIYNEDGVLVEIGSEKIEWVSTNPSVGTIDENGKFQGLSIGETKIIGNFLNLYDTVEVKVQTEENSILDSLEFAELFQMTGENIDTISTTITAVDSPKTFGNKSLKIDYSYTYQTGQRASVFLNADIPIYGLPIAIYLDVDSDCDDHLGKMIFRDSVNKKFYKYFGFPFKFDGFASYYVAMNQLTADGHSDDITMPLAIESIQIKLRNNANDSDLVEGTIYIDNLHLLYAGTDIKDVELNGNPKKFRLNQNYPNPFNNTTTIEYYLPTESAITIEIYNLLGAKVATLIKKVQFAGSHKVEFNGDNLSSGIYFYVVKGFEKGNKRKQFSSARKFVLLK
ncbi:MAG: phosphodiester glycosidase family protein [Candidatus Marinimicrobia bacterium]|nr:phosphodiester glycosidase family protein [Candidatus Neomarinimicrobiota bacterium]